MPSSKYFCFFYQVNSPVFPELSVFFLCVINVYFCKVRWVKKKCTVTQHESLNWETVVALFRCSWGGISSRRCGHMTQRFSITVVPHVPAARAYCPHRYSAEICWQSSASAHLKLTHTQKVFVTGATESVPDVTCLSEPSLSILLSIHAGYQGDRPSKSACPP